MIAELVVFAVLVVTTGYLYLKGSILKSFIFFICALIASFVALSFFETAGRLVMGYGYGGQWIFTALMILIFAIVFILLLAISEKIEPLDLYFGDIPDRIGRCILAIPGGLVIAGVIIIAVNVSPLAGSWPYQRFAADNKNTKADSPDKTLILNADGFVAGFSSLVSKGSLSGSKSLAVFHPSLLNELSLNRVVKQESDAIMAGSEAIKVTKAYYPSQQLADAIKNKVPGSKLVIVEAEIKNSPVKDGGALYLIESGTVTFTLGQVRLMCSDAADTFTGQGKVVFPTGWVTADGKIETKGLTEEIQLAGSEFPSGTKTYNFIFNVPADKTPVMLQFKLNAVAEISRVHKADESENPEESKPKNP